MLNFMRSVKELNLLDEKERLILQDLSFGH